MSEAPDVSMILQEGQLESQTGGEDLDGVVLPQPPAAVEEPSSKAPQIRDQQRRRVEVFISSLTT